MCSTSDHITGGVIADMASSSFDIIKEVSALAEAAPGWRKELDLISWNESISKTIIITGHAFMRK